MCVDSSFSFCRIYLTKMNSTSKFKTLIFIDLETTGLPYDDPKITELAMLAVNV